MVPVRHSFIIVQFSLKLNNVTHLGPTITAANAICLATCHVFESRCNDNVVTKLVNCIAGCN